MNYRDILQLKTDVETKVESGSIVDSNSSNTKIYEALQNLLTEIKPESLRKVTKLRNAFSKETNIYRLPDDLLNIEYVRINDSNDIDSHYNKQNFTNVRAKTITSNNRTLEYATEFINGEQTIVIDNTRLNTSNQTIESYDSIDNLTTLNIENITIEKDDVYKENSIKFDLDINSKNAVLYSTHTEPIKIGIKGDLSFNLRVKFPDSKTIDSVTLELTDGVENIELTETNSLQSNRFEDGWNLINFRLNKNSKVNLEAVTISDVSFAYNSSNKDLTDEVKGLIIDELSVTNGHDIIISYISNSPFYDINTKEFLSEPNGDDNVIQLDNQAYTILLNELGFVLSNELQGEDGVFNRNLFTTILYGDSRNKKGLYFKYKSSHRNSIDIILEKYYQPKSNPRTSSGANY